MPRLELADWRARFGVLAGITTRGEGGEGGEGFSLGLATEEPVAPVMHRWRALRAALRPRFPAVVSSHQVHGALIRWHEQRSDGWLVVDELDGHATATPGLLLTVTVADCIPIYLIAPRTGAMALLHAGWRGVAARILERGVELLQQRAAVPASDIVMHCGVGICGRCYEVGPEVAAQFTGRAETAPQRIDLRTILAAQARALGIGEVSLSSWCSAHDRQWFFSHRASRGHDGRMVAHLGKPLA